MASGAVDFYFSANAKDVIQAINGIQGRLRKLEQAGAPVADVGQQMGGGFNFAAGAAGALKTALGALGIASFTAGALKAVGALKEFGAGCISAAAEMEAYQTRFATLLGDSDKAQSHFSKLRKYAADTPFELAGIAKASTALLAFGVKAEESMEILRMLGDVAAGSGGNLEELAQIYGKANTIGKLDTVDFNQLGNRGLDLRSAIGARDGISTKQVQKNIEAGEYSVKDLLYTLKQATSEGGLFFGATENSSKTLKGQWATLTDNVEELKSSLGEVLVPEVKRLLELGVDLVNKWGKPMVQGFIVAEQTIRSIWRGATEIGGVLAKWVPHFALVGKVHNALTEGIRGHWREYEDMAAALEERKEWLAEPIFKTSVELAHERELAHQTQLRAMAEQEVAEFAEKAAKRAEEEKKTRADMQKTLAADRGKRESDAALDLFASQNAAGMRAELAYRFRQATGKEWQGIEGMDEAALRAAEDKAARKADAGAMAELAALREYAGLYTETLRKEIEVQNQRTAALDAARAAEVQAAELADARERGNLAAVQDLEAAAAAERKYAELRGLGMEHAEAANWAAGAAGREHGRTGMASAPGEWMRDDLAAVGGGGAAIRIPNAQLAVQRQQLNAAQLTNKLLEKLLQKPATVTGLPVVP